MITPLKFGDFLDFRISELSRFPDLKGLQIFHKSSFSILKMLCPRFQIQNLNLTVKSDF
jgi:hypothetical protein